MKRFFLSIFLLGFGIHANAFDCMATEYGGTGKDLKVGTTTSGTWYVWNCVLPDKTVKANGFVIVKNHKPTASCMVANMNPFANPTDAYNACYSVTPEEGAKYTRLLKSLETAKSNLPKEYP